MGLKFALGELQPSGHTEIAFGENCEIVTQKSGFEIWGVGHFWGSLTWGDLTPDLTPNYCSPGDPKKKIFGTGAIGHYLGEIWGPKNWIFDQIWAKFF